MKTIQFKKQSSKAYRIIDLFAGIGGIRLGFESSGRYRTVFSSEIDRFARETYHTNFGEEPEGTSPQSMRIRFRMPMWSSAEPHARHFP